MEEEFTMTIEPNYLDTASFLGRFLVEKTSNDVVISFAQHIIYLVAQAREATSNGNPTDTVTDLDTLMELLEKV